jgi:superfamily II DNA or RNA helicase
VTAAATDRPPLTDWIGEAACGDADPTLFDGAVSAESAAYCARCPVRPECVAEAIASNSAGAWGGLSQADRDAMAGQGWTLGVALPPVASPPPRPAARRRQPAAPRLRLVPADRGEGPPTREVESAAVEETPRPRPHQQRALSEIQAALAGDPRIQAVMACGTGKTLVGRWTPEQMGAHLTLVLLPSLVLVAQALREWRRPAGWAFRALVVCSDPSTTAGVQERGEDGEDPFARPATRPNVPVTTDPDVVARFLEDAGADHQPQVVFATYHSAPVVDAAVRRARTPVQIDLAVLDEAHRLANTPQPAFRATLDDQAIPVARRLFMTATPVLMRGLGRPDEDAAVSDRRVLSMDDARVFGPVGHRLSFADAIAQDLLCDYRVLVVATRAAAKEPLPLPVTLAALHDGIARYGLRRILSFHQRVASAEAFAALAGAGVAGAPPLWAQAVRGEMTVGHRRRVLGRLEALGDGEAGVVASARCLSEGVDVPAVDGVLFADPRRSLVDIVQAVGRVLRKAPGKTRGTVIVPVAVPPGTDDEDTLMAGPFAHVWAVLRALRAHDERLAGQLDELTRLTARRPDQGRWLRGDRVQFVLPPAVPVAAAKLRLVKQTGHRWERMYGLLERYVADHGDSRVPGRYLLDDEPLGAWVSTQRASWRRGLLAPDRHARLIALPGWAWRGDQVITDRSLVRLTAHITRLGSATERPTPPGIYAGARDGQNKPLGWWVATQRQARRDGTLDPDLAARLEALPGWDWQPLPDIDVAGIDALRAFVAREGHANPTFDHLEGTLPLGRWVADVRRRKLIGTLHPALEDELLAATPPLEHTGQRFLWDKPATQWRLGVEALERFIARERHADVPNQRVEQLPDVTVDLGQWCARARWLHRRGRLTPERVTQLEALPGWAWNTAGVKGRHRPTGRSPVPIDLGPVAHGTPCGYDRGCGCGACLEAHRPYQEAARTAAPGPDEVPANRARARLRALVRRDVAMAEVAKLVGVAGWRLQRILDGVDAHISRPADAALAGLVVAAVAEHRRSRAPRATPEAAWQRRYELLARWAADHGHARPPEDLIVDGVRLSRWVLDQRAEWARGRLAAKRIARLEALPGWAWRVSDQEWEDAFARLQAFVADRAHARVPQTHRAPDGFYLGAWVSNQRRARAGGTLLPARAARLEALPGWVWDVSGHADFQAGLAALRRFASEFGHACPTARYVAPDGFKLGRWVANHRHRRAKLDPAQFAQLEALPGWQWDPFEANWQAAYQALARFAARNGHTFVPPDHVEPAAGGNEQPQPIGRWVTYQRSDQHAGKVPAHRQRLLEALPGWTWDGYQARRGVARTRGSLTPPPAIHAEPAAEEASVR